jgi:hypothetical protein
VPTIAVRPSPTPIPIARPIAEIDQPRPLRDAGLAEGTEYAPHHIKGKGLPAMSEINEFSKRFLADFIAARLRAVRIEKDAPRRDQGVVASTRAEEGPVHMPTNQIHSRNSSRRFDP